MPETTVYEDNCVKPAENNVRLASQIFSVDHEAITSPVQCTPDQKFRLRVRSPDSCHIAASGCGIMNIRHIPAQAPHRSVLLLR